MKSFVIPMLLFAGAAGAQAEGSIPVRDIEYQVTFDSATADLRIIKVGMTFNATAPGAVLLSLPEWTPGAYEVSNFARFINDFSAAQDNVELDWDKTDKDTWRLRVPKAGKVEVKFDYKADSLDNGYSWTKSNFSFFNGTNLFFYPEGTGMDFPATVTVKTNPAWRVATGMHSTGVNTFSANNYHDLVDMPFFVGQFDMDSTTIAGKPFRFASYPSGTITPAVRLGIFQQMAKIVPYQAMVFGEVPWDSYTIFQVADGEFSLGAASGLEHQNSHLDIISPVVLGNPILASLYSHEVFHAWNVKRLRPADMTPYQYDREQPTPLLWISEGVTDYYADLAQVRGKTITPRGFYGTTTEKIDHISETVPVSLEDASVSTWIKPVNGTEDIYYDKGSVAGLLLDIIIRDASDNRKSLDTVMRELYDNTYKKGKGFTNDEWWAAVSRAAGGKSFADFERRYIDGRDPFPYDSVLPSGGLRLFVERTVRPSLGISISEDEEGLRVMQVVVAGPGATAGVKLGDYLLKVGGLDANDPGFQEKFNAKYAAMAPGGTVPIEIRRGTQRLTLNAPVRFTTTETRRLIELTNASPKAIRVRDGLLNGTLQQ
ncbi:MAG TPA: PDZ domain-containing protein [Gemmatimonadaceae bacterium]|nr:PDZ domain-containing protein [Gemmatimonadaceae bacterium]